MQILKTSGNKTSVFITVYLPGTAGAMQGTVIFCIVQIHTQPVTEPYPERLNGQYKWTRQREIERKPNYPEMTCPRSHRSCLKPLWGHNRATVAALLKVLIFFNLELQLYPRDHTAHQLLNSLKVSTLGCLVIGRGEEDSCSLSIIIPV